MTEGAQARFLADGRRLHLHHGPIDLIIDAKGPGREVALRTAVDRFQNVLSELAGELDFLRQPVGPVVLGPAARRMRAAVAPFAPVFVTPMAAVAGSVADEILGVMVAAGDLRTAYVNNGGDVAFHVATGEEMVAQIADGLSDRAVLRAGDGVRGVATSGWRGRSQSLGIADSVTVLAPTAAAADAAATLIANAVDLPGHPAIRRCPATEISPDSDLGARLVTVEVGPLGKEDIDRALAAGLAFARGVADKGLIRAARLSLQGHVRIAGDMPGLEIQETERLDA